MALRKQSLNCCSAFCASLVFSCQINHIGMRGAISATGAIRGETPWQNRQPSRRRTRRRRTRPKPIHRKSTTDTRLWHGAVIASLFGCAPTPVTSSNIRVRLASAARRRVITKGARRGTAKIRQDRYEELNWTRELDCPASAMAYKKCRCQKSRFQCQIAAALPQDAPRCPPPFAGEGRAREEPRPAGGDLNRTRPGRSATHQ